MRRATPFINLRNFLDAAGGTPDDVVNMSVTLEDDDLRPLVNEEWLAVFPDEGSRPARHITVKALPHAMLIQIQVVAVGATEGGTS